MSFLARLFRRPASGHPPNRFFEAWGVADRRARLAWTAAAVQSLLAVACLALLHAEKTKEPLVYRVACDGIPTPVTLTEAYFEPSESELRSFGANFAIHFMRGDSFSLRQDLLWCVEYMEARLAERFKREARGSSYEPGAITVVESLGRRTEIPRVQLEVAVDKRPWPWVIKVSGVRRTLGDNGAGRKWDLELHVVRTTRRLLPEGLVVVEVKTNGAPVVGPALRSIYGES